MPPPPSVHRAVSWHNAASSRWIYDPAIVESGPEVCREIIASSRKYGAGHAGATPESRSGRRHYTAFFLYPSSAIHLGQFWHWPTPQEAIRALLQDPKKRKSMGQKAQEYIQAHHDIEAIWPKTLDVFHTLIAEYEKKHKR